jgi:hypothetical protein
MPPTFLRLMPLLPRRGRQSQDVPETGLPLFKGGRVDCSPAGSVAAQESPPIPLWARGEVLGERAALLPPLLEVVCLRSVLGGVVEATLPQSAVRCCPQPCHPWHWITASCRNDGLAGTLDDRRPRQARSGRRAGRTPGPNARDGKVSMCTAPQVLANGPGVRRFITGLARHPRGPTPNGYIAFGIGGALRPLFPAHWRAVPGRLVLGARFVAA